MGQQIIIFNNFQKKHLRAKRENTILFLEVIGSCQDLSDYVFQNLSLHEWRRQNFSLQYDIKHTNDDNIEKKQLEDY